MAQIGGGCQVRLPGMNTVDAFRHWTFNVDVTHRSLMMNIQQLSASEKILLAEELWESVRLEFASQAISEEQRKELENRLAAFEMDGDSGDSWNNVRRRITST